MGNTLTRDTLFALYRQDFRPFARLAYACAHSGEHLDENWHLDAICMSLMDIEKGLNSRLIINCPPRSLKTFIVSVAFPVWQLGRNPASTALIVSHTLKLSKSILAEVRRLLKSPEIHAVFPHLKGATIKSTEDDIQTESGGRLQSFSIDSNVTGHGASLIIIDDPLDASESFSQAEMHKANTIIDTSIMQRLNKPATDPVVLVMQRLAVDDPTGHLLAQGGCTHLCLPAIATHTEQIRIGHNKYHHRMPGDLLFPERYPLAYLENRKTSMGNAGFSAQFQQAPVPDAGGTISLSDFKRFSKPPEDWDCQFVSIDPATGSDSGSYTAMLRCTISNGRLYIASAKRDRIDIAEQFKQIQQIVRRDDPDFLLVEDAGPGKSLLELLYREFNQEPYVFRNPKFIQALTPKTSKVDRMEAVLHYVRDGKVLLPHSASWLTAFEKELVSFPGGKHDDFVDALSQAIKMYEFYMTDPCLRALRGLPPHLSVS